jgi:hypothetical protein
MGRMRRLQYADVPEITPVAGLLYGAVTSV